MSRDFPRIYANENNRHRMASAIRRGTLAHAYIIEGPDGSGRQTFATHVAAAQACAMRHEKAASIPCGECPACRKILTQNSADVHYLRPTGASISVDAIRQIRSDMYLSSTENDKKVYIIEEAQAMTVQAQNALLIVLEEPPTDILIFLLTDRVDALLTTIRSRAQHVRMELLPMELLESASQEVPALRAMQNNRPEEFRALLECSGGCLGQVLELADSKSSALLLETRDLAIKAVNALCSRARYSEMLKIKNALPTKRQEVTQHLSLMQGALRDLIVLSRDSEAPLCCYTSRQDALALSRKCTLTRLIALYDAVKASMEAITYNANVNLTLQSLFSIQ